MKRPRVLHIVTVPQSLIFIEGHLSYLKLRGFGVTVACSPGQSLAGLGDRMGIPVHPVPMERRPAPWADLKSFLRLVNTIRSVRPDIVHSHTPKAGLLGTLAARQSKVPVAVLSIFGLPQMTAAGSRKRLLDASTRLACRSADRVWTDSQSMADHIVREDLCPSGKLGVLQAGSSHGVDAEGYFCPRERDRADSAVRKRLGIPSTSVVVGFVGRVVRDKGLIELEAAWRCLRQVCASSHLLIVGEMEVQDRIPSVVDASLRSDARVHIVGSQNDVRRYYAAMDIVCLPTYREGFPNVLLEAAAMELPVVATRIPGCIDAVVDGVTGTLVPARDAGALADALMAYMRSPELRRLHGLAGRERVLRDFRPQDLSEALYQEYVRLLRLKGLPLPAPATEVTA